jgi:phage shock protein C
MNKRKLYRSDSDRVLFGVCGGLADHFQVDSLLFRIIFLALFFGGGFGLLLYIILAIFVPLKSDPLASQKEINFNLALGLFLLFLGLAFLASTLLSFNLVFFNFWPLLLIIIALFLLFKDFKYGRKKR